MSPGKKRATSTRHAKAKRAAKRSRGKRRKKAAARKEAAAKAARLALVKRPAAKPRARQSRPARAPVAVTEFAGAKAGAAPKDLALFELERARVAVHAAIQGLPAGAADRPMAEDKWSVRQTVLHLAFWDRELMQKYLEAAAARNQRANLTHPEVEAVNAAVMPTLEHHDWESAKRLLQSSHDALWDALDSIPAEPAEVWSREHAVGNLVRIVTKHDRQHADVIKRWRAEQTKERTP